MGVNGSTSTELLVGSEPPRLKILEEEKISPRPGSTDDGDETGVGVVDGSA